VVVSQRLEPKSRVIHGLESLELTVRQALSVENARRLHNKLLKRSKNIFKQDITTLSTKTLDSTIESDESGLPTMYSIAYYMELLQRIAKTGREVRDDVGSVESALKSK
jgi:hypothetical protein